MDKLTASSMHVHGSKTTIMKLMIGTHSAPFTQLKLNLTSVSPECCRLNNVQHLPVCLCDHVSQTSCKVSRAKLVLLQMKLMLCA